MRSLRGTIAIAACFSVLVANDVQAVETKDREELLAGIVTGHVVPRFQVLETKISDLKSAVRKACRSGQSPARTGTRYAFADALAAWMGVQHLRFGPTMTSDRIYRFQYWPDKHGQGARQMRKLLDGPADRIPDRTAIAKTSVAIQGFPALERLLFTRDAPADGQRAKFCTLAQSVTGNLAGLASSTLRDWRAYQPDDPQEAATRLIRSMVEQLQVISELKLKRPLGSSAAKARPRRAENWRSQRSFDNIRQNFRALLELVTGAAGWNGLRSTMSDAGERVDAANALIENLGYGSKVIGEQTVPLAQAVKTEEGRKFITFLIAHTDGIRDLVVEQLAPALGIELGFNAQDGD